MSNSAMDEDDVARWAIRLDGGPLSVEEQAELDSWLMADERRSGALLRAEAALAYLDRGSELAEPADEFETDSPQSAASFGRRAFFVGGSLTALVAATIAGFVLTKPQGVDVRTAIGEVRRIELADGSVASVNTNSRLAFEVLNDRRRAVLSDGEAWFQVAHDQAKPFVVEAGRVRVRAIGTAFSVRKRADGADVMVSEGVVDTWIAGHEVKRARIAAGWKGFVADVAPTIEMSEGSGDVERALAWRNGEIALNGESLAYAVSELNRYNTRKLIIDDSQLGREPLVGYFRTDQPERFGRTVADMLDAQIEVEGGTIRLSR